jgi:4-amino-4-deoxy-L-arabinose transferase-like glycosyltransferase
MAYHPGNREQETEYQGKSEIRWLLLTILVGFALRVYGIGPYHYHPDESDFIVRAMRFGTGDLNPHWFGHPGSIFMYLLFAIYGLCFILGQLSGSFSDWTSFGTLFQTDPIPFYVMGRTVNALFGTLTIPVVYLIARRIFNKPTGLVSSLLMTVSLLHTQFSKLVRTDILTTVFVLLAVLWAVYAYETRRHRDYALSGIFVGLATAAKYTSLAVVVPPLLAYLLDEGWENIKQPESLLSRKSFLGLLVVSALILLTGFLADVSRTSVLAASFISTDGVIEAFGLKFLRLFQIGLIALGTLGLATTAIAGLWRPFGNLVGGLLKDKKVILLLSCVFIGFAASTPFFFFELRTVYWNLIIEARGTQLGNESLSGLANYVWYITQPLIFGG